MAAEPSISNAEEALLAAVAVRRKRNLTPLTLAQEKLIDDWTSGFPEVIELARSEQKFAREKLRQNFYSSQAGITASSDRIEELCRHVDHLLSSRLKVLRFDAAEDRSGDPFEESLSRIQQELQHLLKLFHSVEPNVGLAALDDNLWEPPRIHSLLERRSAAFARLGEVLPAIVRELEAIQVTVSRFSGGVTEELQSALKPGEPLGREIEEARSLLAFAKHATAQVQELMRLKVELEEGAATAYAHLMASNRAEEEITNRSEQARQLVRTSAAAAERVLERQLMEAAEASPPISADLERRILAIGAPKPAPMKTWPFWRLSRFHFWQVSGVAGALAAMVAVVVTLPQLTGHGPVQLAMASISDRDVLFEPADVRMRGAPQTAPSVRRFKDLVIPESVLEGLLDSQHGEVQRSALKEFRTRAGIGDENAFVIVDSALAQRARAPNAADIGVRLYDLQDSRVADIRAKITPPPPVGAAYLVTVKP